MKHCTIFIVVLILFCTLISYGQLKVKDQDSPQHTLVEINDEGISGSISLPPLSSIGTSTNKLYNIGSSLFWNGSALSSTTSADNLGNHIATQNLNLAGYELNLNGGWLSGDGEEEGIFVHPNGDIGLGTSTPTAGVHVCNINLPTMQISYPNVMWGASLLISTDQNIGYGNSVSLLFGSDYDESPNYAAIGQYNDGSLRLAGRDAIDDPDMVITDAGNVGIGLTNPSYKLDISGGNFLVRGNDGYTATGHTGTIYLGSLHSYIKAEYGYGVKIGAYAAPDAISIKQLSGSVGIGTTAPNEKLEVDGKIRSNYVFNVSGADGISGTYNFATNESSGIVESITITGGIITSVNVTP